MSLALLPRPAAVTPGEGVFELSSNTPVHCADPALSPVADYLARRLGLERLSGTPARVPAGAVHLTIDTALTHPEAYRLHITAKAITLAAGSEAGGFYAVQSLLQLLPEGEHAGPLGLPAVQIEDVPAFGWRGMHLDCARHFFPVAFIKQYLDLLALHKMNRFHWHLTDDQGWRLDIDGYPELTEIGAWRERTVDGHTSNRDRRYREGPYGGCYSREDVREIVAYARARCIEVIPEIDIPGHAAALLAAHPELACRRQDFRVESHFGIFPDVLCPREETFDLLEAVFRQVAELFPGEYVHIGGDEVVKTAWSACPHCQRLIRERGLGDENGLHGYFVSRVAQMLRGLGKRVIGWDEVLDGEVPADTTVMCWNRAAPLRALERGHPVVVTPVDTVYFDFYQSTSLDEPAAIHGLTPLRRVYDFDPLPTGVSPRDSSLVLGAQGNVWTEYLATPEAVCYAVLPRLSALAEVLWSGPGGDWRDFCTRLPVLMDRLQRAGYVWARSAWKPSARGAVTAGGQLEATLDCELPGLVLHYTLDGSPPDEDSPRYRKPLAIDGDQVLRAVALSRDGQRYGDERLHLSAHLALGRAVCHLRDGALVADAGLGLLTNGCRASERIFQYHEWVAFDAEAVDIVVDLERPQPVASLSFNIEAGAHRRLARPARVAVLGAGEDRRWQPLDARDETALPRRGELVFSWPRRPLRYLRLQLDNSLRYYSPESRREQRWPLYLDELVVR